MNTKLYFLAATAMMLFARPVSSDGQTVIPVETDKISLVMGADSKGVLRNLYLGERVSRVSDFEAGLRMGRRGYEGNDIAYLSQGGLNTLEPALSIRYPDGYMNTELYYVSSSTSTSARNGDIVTTEILLRDPVTLVEVKLVYEAFRKENVIKTHSEIKNGGKQAVELLNYYSGQIHVAADRYLLTHFNGEWAGEMSLENEILTHGIKVIESKEGARTTPKENPSFLLTLDSSELSEDSGKVIAGAVAWTGNFRMNFQVDDVEGLTILCGINPYMSPYPLAPGKVFVTPDMVYTYSSVGAGQASRNLHDWARNYGDYAGTRMIPTLLNSWEGAYFSFNTKILTDMIDDAADMGLEMFVVDDGWFGMDYPRNSDNQGLGDWELNTRKIPEGIDYVATYAHDKGLKFGIWIEPEMVNPNSNLALNHPDWIVRSKGRDVPQIRNQWNLDMTNPEVQDFVFEVFDNTVKLSKNIDYIKWDCNKNITSFGSDHLGKEQNRFYVEYVQGLYSVMRRIREKYPDIMIQACASGGGRMDYGALQYFNEFWVSDNTDALSRVKMQYDAGMIFPANVLGSHVSTVPNHQTGNTTPLKFRFDVACSGRLGMELQPKTLSDDERTFAKQAISSYKQYRDLVFFGDLYRVKSPYDTDFSSVMYVSKDKSRAVVFTYCLKAQNSGKPMNFHLKGLDAGRQYNVRELNVGRSGCPQNGKTLGGDYLASAGLTLLYNRLYDSHVFYLTSE